MEETTRSSSSAFWCGVRIGRSAPGAAPRVLLLLSCFISQLNAPLHDGNPTFYAHYYPRENLNVLDRARIISPNASDAEQIRTPKVASFLRDVALRDLAVHATHAACVDGRGDVYQWGDGFFGQQSESASGDRKPVLTLRGKVRSCLSHSLSISLRSKLIFSFHLLYCFSLLTGITAVVCVWPVGHHEGAGHGISRICAFGFWEGVCHIGASSTRRPDALEHCYYVAVGHGLAMGRR
jgi:hypothetical protein